MVTALLVGLVVGFVMVMPPGPIAMACMRQALAGRETGVPCRVSRLHSAVSFVLGANT
jgi:threonine/homoserine/homoserine lactone efflux protein